MRGTLEQRFWAGVEQGGLLDCWEWKAGRTAGGYGQIWDAATNRVLYAHRVSLVLAGVTVADTDFVLHNCDNRPCVNPAHLYVGTIADNWRDLKERGRPKAWKLTKEQVSGAREAYAAGATTMTALARLHSVDKSTMRRAIRGITWRG